MANWHGYFAVENLNLSASQRATLVGVLRQLGPASHPQPCMRNHRRVRLDGEAVIFEALFNEDDLTVAWFKQRLGAIFDVDPETIDHDLSNVTFVARQTPVVVFSRSGTDYLRMALFGGPGTTWEQSRIEAIGYLAANRAEWETNE